MVQIITDPKDERLTYFRNLTDSQNRMRSETEQRIFVAESINVVEAALQYGCVPIAVLTEPRFVEGTAKRLIASYTDVPFYTAEENLIANVTGYKLNRGILAVFKRPAMCSLQDILRDSKRLAVLEGIADAANIGAIFRSASALGADGIVLTDSCCDPYYRRALRVSMGTVFKVPWVKLQKGISGAQVASQMNGQGYETLAFALDKNAVDLGKLKHNNEKRIALFFGNEGKGLLDETIEACSKRIYIPMMNGVESLNVAAASAVSFWTLCR